MMVGVGYYLLSPLWTTTVVNEELPVNTTEDNEKQQVARNEHQEETDSTSNEAHPIIIRTGQFVGADELHQVSGTAQIYQIEKENWLRFEEFTSTNGPDLFVYLVKDEQNTKEGINLGKLKGNEGSQNYVIPDSINLNEGSWKVVIWCRAFNVDFGEAIFRKA
jgi:hypothetical protein